MLKWIVVGLLATAGLSGCTGVPTDPQADLVDEVDAKATQVAEQIGGTQGFGGHFMDGYFQYGPLMMGFAGYDDLATSDGVLTVRCTNLSDEDATFHMAYFASHLGLTDQYADVEVAAGSTVDFAMPCAEIVGVGALETPGAYGCRLASGAQVDNRFAVPGFLNSDYTCGGVYPCTLMQDVDDLDGDGDTAEWILVTDNLYTHMSADVAGGFHHGPGGMMGGGMMGLP